MDTSKKYIEMCEKAEEIQKLWTKDSTDFVFDGKLSGIAIDLTHDIKFMLFIWLPRQDQLQEIFGTFARCYNELVGWGHDIATNNASDEEVKYIEGFESMEQLWLAFVMKEKWNKVWDGKEWVKKG